MIHALRHLRRGLAALALALLPAILLPAGALAQTTPAYQDASNFSVGDALKFSRAGIYTKAGGLTGDINGKGLNPFSVTDSLGLGFCLNSAVTTGQYNALCFGHDSASNGVIDLSSYGGLANKTVVIRANGTTVATISEAGIALVGAPTALTQAGGDNTAKLATTGFVTQAVGAAGVAPLPYAATSAALAAISSATNTRAQRCGVNAAGDAPCLLFTLSVSACSHADTFSQVTLTGGGCATAVWPDAIDPRQFGAKLDGSTDDTAAWTAIDTAEGFMAVKPPVRFSGTSVVCTIGANGSSFANIAEIVGVANPVLKSCPTFLADHAILNYAGTGPLTVKGITCQQPVYVSNVQPANSGYCIATSGLGGETQRVLIEDVYSIGGSDAAVDIHSASDVTIRNLTCDRPYLWCLHIATTQATSAIKIQQITVEGLRCFAAGAECAALPNNQSNVASGATRAVRLTGYADGCGFQGGHTCFAIAGSASDQFDIRVSGANGAAGLLSVKRNNDFSSVIPSIVSNSYYEATYNTSIDAGAALIYSHDSGSVGDGTFYNQIGVARATFDMAAGWQASTTYGPGDVVSHACAAASGYCVYGSLGNGATSPQGTSAGSGGPTGRVSGAQIADGTVNWLYLGDAAQTGGGIQVPQTVDAVSFVGSVSDIVVKAAVQGTAGCADFSSNEANDVMRRITVSCDGTIHGAAVTDNSNSGSFTVDYLTLANWHVHSLGDSATDNALIYIGGGQGLAAVTYLHPSIDGGDWRQDNGIRCLRNSSASATLGNDNNRFYVHGAPLFRCGQQFMLTTAPISLEWAGGGDIGIYSHAGTPFQADGAAVTALNSTVRVAGTVNIVTDATVGTGDYQGWSDTNAAVANWDVDRLLRGFATSIPVNTACNYGDTVANQTPSASVMHDWRCTTPSTTSGTWTGG